MDSESLGGASTVLPCVGASVLPSPGPAASLQPSDLGAAVDELPFGGGEPASERGFFEDSSVSPVSLPAESKSDLWERDRFREELRGAELGENRL